MRLEQEFTRALDKVAQATRDSDRLVLSADGEPLLVFERARP
jgi:hypothetical protein